MKNLYCKLEVMIEENINTFDLLFLVIFNFPFSLEKYGGICDCQSTRDTFLYAASVDRRGLDATIEILGDVVLRPTITDEEIEVSKAAIRFVLTLKVRYL